MKKAQYVIKRESERFTVFKDGKYYTKGFVTHEDALHSIWQKNGCIPNHFYTHSNGEVKLEIS